MAVSKAILGMNARNFLYLGPYNPSNRRSIADNKLETKETLLKEGLSTPALMAVFPHRDELWSFDWEKLPEEGFVVKPARGYAGSGIMAVKRWEGGEGETVAGETVSSKELETLVLDILEGAHSLQNVPDSAFIEERIKLHSFFKKRLVPYGVPDIRVIVFNKVPVMAMLRLPTKESRGKANVHLGALGIGIGMRTGITTHAVRFDKKVRRVPCSGRKTRGLKIPMWKEILLLAAEVGSIVDLGYIGVDIVLDAKKGPSVLEINARPGLSIQLANMASLRTRLERVEFMDVSSVERAVEMARSLFGETFSEKVAIRPIILDRIETVTLEGKEKKILVEAKIDSGAFRTSIDESLGKELDLFLEGEEVKVLSSSGRTKRKLAKLTFRLREKRITSKVSLIDRSHMDYKMIIGARDLEGFLIDPSQPDLEE